VSDKTYKVKEIYYTLQGEGAHAGRPAIFLRFAGCNLWSGREEDRHKAVCQFCDTDFVGTDGDNGGKYTAQELVAVLWDQWPDTVLDVAPYVVCTGGEPALQIDTELIDAMHEANITIAIETNGTIVLPQGIDWVCMSPKEGSDIVVTAGDELKLVYPQSGLDPFLFVGMDFDHFYLQPMDSEAQDDNTLKAINYCKAHPQWRLSIQTHKVLGID
jgi:7-carboxy-7-deazaguanine synthase (Cx14CxxC type)